MYNNRNCGRRKKEKETNISKGNKQSFRQKVGNKQQQELWEEEERERKKQISAREITKFRQRVGNKQQQELWEEGERERKKQISAMGNNKV